jgi:hypothetical protein
LKEPLQPALQFIQDDNFYVKMHARDLLHLFETRARAGAYKGMTHKGALILAAAIIGLAIAAMAAWQPAADQNTMADWNVPGATTGPGRNSLRP